MARCGASARDPLWEGIAGRFGAGEVIVAGMDLFSRAPLISCTAIISLPSLVSDTRDRMSVASRIRAPSMAAGPHSGLQFRAKHHRRPETQHLKSSGPSEAASSKTRAFIAASLHPGLCQIEEALSVMYITNELLFLMLGIGLGKMMSGARAYETGWHSQAAMSRTVEDRDLLPAPLDEKLLLSSRTTFVMDGRSTPSISASNFWEMCSASPASQRSARPSKAIAPVVASDCARRYHYDP